MKRFLVINPNTTVEVTHLLKSSMLQFSSSLIEIETVTASFGANYIADEASYVIASYSVLDSWSQSLESDRIDFDHILIGCFGDPGLHALKECSRIPVTGLAHASFLKGDGWSKMGAHDRALGWCLGFWELTQSSVHAWWNWPLLYGEPASRWRALDPCVQQSHRWTPFGMRDHWRRRFDGLCTKNSVSGKSPIDRLCPSGHWGDVRTSPINEYTRLYFCPLDFDECHTILAKASHKKPQAYWGVTELNTKLFAIDTPFLEMPCISIPHFLRI